MFDNDGALNDIDFLLNGRKLQIRAGLNDSFFFNVAHHHMYPLFKKKESWWSVFPCMKSWATIPVQVKKIAGTEKVEIKIVAGDSYKSGSSRIYGSYLSKARHYCGPRLPVSMKNFGTPFSTDQARFSLWKYQTTYDIRLHGCQDYPEPTVVFNEKLLSNNGATREYNIRLQLIMVDGSELIL